MLLAMVFLPFTYISGSYELAWLDLTRARVAVFPLWHLKISQRQVYNQYKLNMSFTFTALQIIFSRLAFMLTRGIHPPGQNQSLTMQKKIIFL